MNIRFAIRNLHPLLFLLCIAGPGALRAQQENPYDVLGKALAPIGNVFALDENGNPVIHAMELDAHLVTASKLPPALQGQAAHLALITPDKLLIQAPIAGEILTVCRNGNSLWVTPGAKVQALLDAAAAGATPGKKKKKHEAEAAALVSAPLALPIPAKELVFLPILFEVADAGTETVAGQPCRVLDVQLMPELAKSLHAEDWSARLWVGANYGIVQLTLTGPDWNGTIAIDKLDFPDTLPDATFQPQGTDVLTLTAAQFIALIGRLGRQ